MKNNLLLQMQLVYVKKQKTKNNKNTQNHLFLFQQKTHNNCTHRNTTLSDCLPCLISTGHGWSWQLAAERWDLALCRLVGSPSVPPQLSGIPAASKHWPWTLVLLTGSEPQSIGSQVRRSTKWATLSSPQSYIRTIPGPLPSNTRAIFRKAVT